MGTTTFLLPTTLSPSERRCLERANWFGAYPGSIDLTPVPTERKILPDRIQLTKTTNDSGYVMMPWCVDDHETPIFLSATLREREEPYYLLVELARGKLNQVRNQLAEWDDIGLQLAEEDRTALFDTSRRFGKIVLEPNTPDSETQIREILLTAHSIAERVTRQFAEQLLGTRLSETPPISTMLGCRLGSLPTVEERERILASFNTVRLVPNWRLIEPEEARYDWGPFDELVDWAISSGLQVSIGPLIDLTHGPFPDWSSKWVGDLPSLSAFACDFVETIVRRYGKRVRWWHAFAGFNHADAWGLLEDDRLRLAARILDSARQTDPDAFWSIGIAQPWGDYLASEEHTYSPLVFVDTIIRAGFALTSIELEFLFGQGTRVSATRDSLDLYKLLDLYGVLGTPLEATFGGELRSRSVVEGEPSLDVSLETINTGLVLAASLPQVCGVFWEEWNDAPLARVAGCNLASAGEPADSILRLYGELKKHIVRPNEG